MGLAVCNAHAMSRSGSLAAAVVMLCVAVAPAAATATTQRYASPAGGGTSPCTTASSPCSLSAALNASGAADEISLATGTYDAAGIVLPTHAVAWVATDTAQPRPVVTSASANPTLALTSSQSGTTFAGVEVTNTAGTGVALSVGSGTSITFRTGRIAGRTCIDAPDPGTITIEDSAVVGSNGKTCASLPASSTIRRSSFTETVGVSGSIPPPMLVTAGLIEDTTVEGGLVLSADGAIARRTNVTGITAISGRGLVVDSVALTLSNTGAAIGAVSDTGGTLRVVNTTAVAPNGGYGLKAIRISSTGSGIVTNKIVATNVIARGATADVHSEKVGGCTLNHVCKAGLIEIDHSVFTTREPASPDGSLTDNGGNLAADPQFVDEATRDLHLKDTSPARDAGVTIDLAQPTDLDGNARTYGAATDIGAYEYAPPPPPPTPPAEPPATTMPPSGTTPPITEGPDVTPPVLGPIGLTRTRFALGTSRTALSARVARGTTLSVAVSEAATVQITVQRIRKGRRPMTLGRAIRRTVVGARTLKVAFSGRYGTQKLKIGSYRFSVTAIDAAGNRSATRMRAFKIVSGRSSAP